MARPIIAAAFGAVVLLAAVTASAGPMGASSASRPEVLSSQVHGAQSLAPPGLVVTSTVLSWTSENQTPDTVAFAGTIHGGTAPFQESWNFGDGAPNASGPAPTHVYTQPGAYLVLLLVSDAANDHATSTIEVDTVNFSIPLSVAAQASPLIVSTWPATPPVAFGLTSSPGTPVRYLWNFGDGQNSSNASPSHTYRAAGEYLAMLDLEYTSNFVGTPPGSHWNVSSSVFG